MKTLYDVQEWLKKYGYINLMPNRLDAIYLMQQELAVMIKTGILTRDDHDYLSARLILHHEEQLEKETLKS